jgi:hypothetical protein
VSLSDDDIKGYTAARLAPYRKPVAAAIARGLALEEAIEATQRACAALVSASVDDPDRSRTDALRRLFAQMRSVLADMKLFQEAMDGDP